MPDCFRQSFENHFSEMFGNAAWPAQIVLDAPAQRVDHLGLAMGDEGHLRRPAKAAKPFDDLVESACADSIGRLATSARTGMYSPWILMRSAPSSMSAPRVPAAWKAAEENGDALVWGVPLEVMQDPPSHRHAARRDDPPSASGWR